MMFEERKLFDREGLGGRLLYKQSGFLVIVDENPLKEGHVLIISEKEHPSCLGALMEFQARHLAALISVVRTLLSDTYDSPVAMFEHGIVGQTVNELHVHCLPMEQDFTERVKNDYGYGSFSFGYYEDLVSFYNVYVRSSRPYILWSPNKKKSFRVCWVPEQFQYTIEPEYLRRLAAEELGFPDRTDGERMDPNVCRQLVLNTLEKLSSAFSEHRLTGLRR